MQQPEIPRFYAGKKILITGATGFIGKVLIWKLLQSCPLVDTIYVLIRRKRGKTDKQRLEEMLNAPIYDNFKKTNQEIFRKIVLISGDIDEKNLNLSDSDKYTLLDEVSIVFHIAATLKMDASLKQAVVMNVEGTLTLLNICLEMKNLLAFVYVSTAYCYCDKDATEEKVYPAKDNPYNIIELVHWMDPDILAKTTRLLIEPHPNTYTYSKRLAENIVLDFYPRLPVVIARPAIVIPSHKEPIPGWIDNLNGVVGISIAVGKGVLRCVQTIPEYNADLVPVDVTCNGLISIAWNTVEQRTKLSGFPVYNISTTEIAKPTWNDVLQESMKSLSSYPFDLILWYPTLTMTRYKIVHLTMTFLFQWIPAYFIDFILLVIGYKPFLVHVQKRIALGTTLLTYFSKRPWYFVTDNIIQLRKSMNSADEALFPVTTREVVDRQEYVNNSAIVARYYLLKEDPSTLPRSKIKLKILYVLHRVTQIFFFTFIFWLLHDVLYKTGVIHERYL